jgi:energy-coupling factor transporter ATP-binding protein EcfA2
MYIRSVRIDNLRCFAHVEADFQAPGVNPTLRFPNVNLLLGGNGAGKSTLLRAVALGLLGPILSSAGFRSVGNVRQEFETARIRPVAMLDGAHISLPLLSLKKQGDFEHIVITGFEAAFDFLHNELASDLLLVGYGAGRRVESEWFNDSSRFKERSIRYQQVASLFETGFALRPMSSWLPEFPGRNRVGEILNELLPENVRFIEAASDGLRFESRGIPVGFDALSDGYRAFLAWIGDLLWSLTRLPEYKPQDREAIVMVDELDLHLHPEWQRIIIEKVARAFPKIQFIFTTHSPILAASLEKENILVMESGEDGSSQICRYKEDVFGKDAEEVLLSSYFGLESTRPVTFEAEQAELASHTSSVNPQVAIEMMKRLVGK